MVPECLIMHEYRVWQWRKNVKKSVLVYCITRKALMCTIRKVEWYGALPLDVVPESLIMQFWGLAMQYFWTCGKLGGPSVGLVWAKWHYSPSLWGKLGQGIVKANLLQEKSWKWDGALGPATRSSRLPSSILHSGMKLSNLWGCAVYLILRYCINKSFLSHLEGMSCDILQGMHTNS